MNQKTLRGLGLRSMRVLILAIFLFTTVSTSFLVHQTFAALSTTSVSLSDSSIGATATYTIVFTPDTGLDTDYDIRLTFPSGTDLTNGSPAIATDDTGVYAGGSSGAGKIEVNSSVIDDGNDHITINLDTVSGGPTTGGSESITIVVSGVINPSYAGSFNINVVTYDETDVALDSGAIPFTVDAGVVMEKVDCDGSATNALGTCNSITPATSIVLIEQADNLCTDSLTDPTMIFTDSTGSGDCNSADGTIVTLLGTASGTQTSVGAEWGFYDTEPTVGDSDGEFDPGEDLMILESVSPDSTTPSAAGVTYSFQLGNQSALTSGDYIVVVFPDDITIADRSVADCDGSTTTNAGACATISDGDTMVATEEADNLCTDSLTAPTMIYIDSTGSGDCNTGDGTITELLGTASGTQTSVGANWAFVDDVTADSAYTDGEDLYVTTSAGDTTVDTITTTGESFTETSTVVSLSEGDNEARILIGSTIAANSEITFNLTDITNATSGGSYLIAINTYDQGTDNVLDMGSALASTGNTVSVSAVVSEALVMTLSNTAISLQVDPAVNSGQDKSESTTLTVSTNAEGGYVLKARLDNGNSSDENRLTDGTNFIPNLTGTSIDDITDSVPSDNYFGYTAADGSTPDTADAENLFMADATNLYTDFPATTTLGGSSTADSATHTVNYDLNVSFTTPAGVYTGTVYYTVVATF